MLTEGEKALSKTGKMTEYNLNDLTQPFIDEEQTQAASNGINKKHEFPKKKIKPKDIAFILISSIGCALLFLYVIITIPGVPILDLSMIIGLILTVVLVVQRIELEKIADIGEAIENFNAKADLLKATNERLSITTTKLEDEFDEKTKRRQMLEFIISIQGITTKSFLRLVKENKQITEKSIMMMKHETLERIFSFVLKLDSNEKFHIEENDLFLLIMNLRNIEGLRDLYIDQFKINPDKKSYSISCLVETCFRIIEEWEFRNKRKDQPLDEESKKTNIFSVEHEFAKNMIESSKSDIESSMYNDVTRTLGSVKEKTKSDRIRVAKFQTLYERSDENGSTSELIDGNCIDYEDEEAKSNESTEAQSSFKNDMESTKITDGNLACNVDIERNRGISESTFNFDYEEDQKSHDATDEIPRFEGIFRESTEPNTFVRRNVQNITLYELDDEKKPIHHQ